MSIFLCAAPLILILFDLPAKIIATLCLSFQVQRTKIFVDFCPVVCLKVQRTDNIYSSTGNICRFLSDSKLKGAAHR